MFHNCQKFSCGFLFIDLFEIEARTPIAGRMAATETNRGRNALQGQPGGRFSPVIGLDVPKGGRLIAQTEWAECVEVETVCSREHKQRNSRKKHRT